MFCLFLMKMEFGKWDTMPGTGYRYLVLVKLCLLEENLQTIIYKTNKILNNNLLISFPLLTDNYSPNFWSLVFTPFCFDFCNLYYAYISMDGIVYYFPEIIGLYSAFLDLFLFFSDQIIFIYLSSINWFFHRLESFFIYLVSSSL